MAMAAAACAFIDVPWPEQRRVVGVSPDGMHVLYDDLSSGKRDFASLQYRIFDQLWNEWHEVNSTRR